MVPAVAIFHRATISPTKDELIAQWARTRPSGPAAGVAMDVIGSYRFDDPDGRVGMETHLAAPWLRRPACGDTRSCSAGGVLAGAVRQPVQVARPPASGFVGSDWSNRKNPSGSYLALIRKSRP
jgi:hypothetical protein